MKMKFWKRNREPEQSQNLRLAMCQVSMQIEMRKGTNGELALREYVS